MEQKIITSRHASDLNTKMVEMIKEGWLPIGGHSVLTTHAQNRFSGMQHKDTTFEYEYSQTMQRNVGAVGGRAEVIDHYLSHLKQILETKTDDIEDIKNLRTATLQFLLILKEKEEELKD